jgi:ribonuclease HII
MKVIAGSDEVGRGCFAGPLVAGAVIITSPNAELKPFQGKDSKQLTAKQRESLSNMILDSYHCSLGVVEVEEIDLLGLTLANSLAIFRAVNSLKIKADIVLVDGNLKFASQPYFSIIRGDRLVESISSASIIAKVYRDRLMQKLHLEFPVYNWHNNKGYGTLEHRRAMLQYGLSIHHRKSFYCKEFAVEQCI